MKSPILIAPGFSPFFICLQLVWSKYSKAFFGLQDDFLMVSRPNPFELVTNDDALLVASMQGVGKGST